ncbi:hypothetical protein GCM10009557_61790 [Virgisporangium ochraceum]|uniref:Uncharacterized protein n=1 Tax=Virgisporangium ochraceum TaxID=65505 RepID=A0A8J3ZZV9_9ACTN|nr:hypothetical protein Voc01_064820 [Virgisporangium ochraceum]
MPSVRIPSAQVTAARDLPRVCARHGRPADQLKSLRFSSRPPAWTYALIPLGLLFFLIAIVVMRNDVWAPSWPWCDRCGRLRVVRLLTGLALFAGALAVLPSVADRRETAATVVTAVVVLALALAAVLLARSYATAIVGAHVTRDSRWVRIPRAHERFAAEVRQDVASAPGAA